MNLQQMPSQGSLAEELRACFISKPGYDLITIDVSSFELRILANNSEEDSWLELYKNGGDLHSLNASMIFDIPVEKAKDPFYLNPFTNFRYVAKTIGFGLAYGMSKYKLSSTIKITLDEAEKIINKFFIRVPKVKKYLDTLSYTAQNYFVSRTLPPIFRARYYPPTKDRSELASYGREGKNAPIQGELIALNKFR
jgi:DNA polymerase-1